MLTKFYPGAHSHNLHFERGKDLFRTFSGAAERSKELPQKPCASLSMKFL